LIAREFRRHACCQLRGGNKVLTARDGDCVSTALLPALSDLPELRLLLNQAQCGTFDDFSFLSPVVSSSETPNTAIKDFKIEAL
jgi:hypothetical protein